MQSRESEIFSIEVVDAIDFDVYGGQREVAIHVNPFFLGLRRGGKGIASISQNFPEPFTYRGRVHTFKPNLGLSARLAVPNTNAHVRG